MRLACLLGAALAAPTAKAATITQVTNFGSNPSGIGMYLYTPSNVVAKPPILVGIHACHGKGLDVCSSGNPFAQQADKYGFLLICPSAVSSDGCWDVHSTADLSHNGSGDASGIISMVNYVVQNKNGDANRIFVAGHSSGAMMTNVLLGSHPDVFKAGAAFAGVPFACFAQGSVDSLGWSATCANGNVTMTGAQWGALVRAAYPGFMGTRPRIQVWHGTADTTLSFHDFGEEIKEWTNVLAVSETPTSTESNALQATWIRTRYADNVGVIQVEAIQETGQPHNLVITAPRPFAFSGSMARIRFPTRASSTLRGAAPVRMAGLPIPAEPWTVRWRQGVPRVRAVCGVWAGRRDQAGRRTWERAAQSRRVVRLVRAAARRWEAAPAQAARPQEDPQPAGTPPRTGEPRQWMAGAARQRPRQAEAVLAVRSTVKIPIDSHLPASWRHLVFWSSGSADATASDCLPALRRTP